jgi:hypothetical protein
VKKILHILLWSATAACVGLGLTFYALAPSNRVIAQWKQPTTVNYNSFDPYSLSVIELHTNYFSLPWEHAHSVFIGRGNEAPGYGHSTDFTFHSAGERVDNYIRLSRVVWSNAGVTLTEPSGNQLFIPKSAFVGGR